MLHVWSHLSLLSFFWGGYHYYYLKFTHEKMGIRSLSNLPNIVQVVGFKAGFEPRHNRVHKLHHYAIIWYLWWRQNLSRRDTNVFRYCRLLAGSLKAKTRVVNLLSPETPSMDKSINQCSSNSFWLIMYLFCFSLWVSFPCFLYPTHHLAVRAVCSPDQKI